MYSNYVDIDIDVFEHKQEILEEGFSDVELLAEIDRRLSQKDSIEKDKNVLNLDFEIDLSDYTSEFMGDTASDLDLINELENRNFIVLENGEQPNFGYITKSKLAQWLGLRGWSTKKQILEELEKLW